MPEDNLYELIDKRSATLRDAIVYIAALQSQLAEANASLRIAIELTEMIDEFNQVGTDSWVWLQQARMLFDAAPPTKGNEHAE